MLLKNSSSQITGLAELLDGLTVQEGIAPSPVSGVWLMRASTPVARHPIIYDPSIVIVGQGSKRGYLGSEVFVYDSSRYLVLSVPLPFECEVMASKERPFLGLSITVDPLCVSELLTRMDMDTEGPFQARSGIYVNPISCELSDAAARLLQSMHSPADSRILGPQIVREIIYYVLRGDRHGVLRALVASNSGFGRIAKLLRRIHEDYCAEFDVTKLAEEAGMSLSSFHHNFKSVTSSSPLRYVKSLRLHKARLLMLQEGMNASTAAIRVGYESASQFSREFKRFFGVSPTQVRYGLKAPG